MTIVVRLCKDLFELQKNNLGVVDRATGLTWQQSGSSKHMNFDQAQEYIDNLNNKRFLGYSDWRLPTLEEAMTLMEPEQKSGNLYIDPIFDQKQWWIWTADKESASDAWVVDFNAGSCDYRDVLDYRFVRAVR